MASGLLFITRPIDIIALAAPFLLHLIPKAERRVAWSHLTKFRTHGLRLVVGAFIVCVPQLIYWRITTGHWIYYSYGEEGFGRPHVIDGLFSFRKGWFIYTPLMFLAMLGFIPLWRRVEARAYAASAGITLAVYITVVFSWWCWYYGGSFGSRPMVDILALTALPLAAMMERIARRGAVARWLLGAVLCACITLNLFQHWQYTEVILRWDGMTRERYFEIFGATSWEGLSPFDP